MNDAASRLPAVLCILPGGNAITSGGGWAMTSRQEVASGVAYTDVDKKEDLKVLHGMGYAQELERRLSRFSNFAVSFSIICILSGGINSLAQATSGAGGAAIGIGWPLGCFISLVF